MVYTGLVSVTFRSLPWQRVLTLTNDAGLTGIEWGGDVHAPPGDLARAQEISRACGQSGITVVCYGSYYRFGECTGAEGAGAPEPPFAAVLDTAVALGAPVIRVWAGTKGSARTARSEREAVVQAARRYADLAAQQHCRIAFEYHGNTLTDTVESALSLIEEINHQNVSLLWQPAVGRATTQRYDELCRVLPQLSHIHCFHWGPAGFVDKRPLAHGADEWRSYLHGLPKERTTWVLLEFLPEIPADHASEGEHQEISVLSREAATLHSFLVRLSPPG